jgi:starch synthase
LQRNAMAREYGWSHAVARYVNLYAELTEARPASAPVRPRRVAVAASAASVVEKNAEQAFVARRA